jgi:DNA-binding HxlR family transcriptional regulator
VTVNLQLVKRDSSKQSRSKSKTPYPNRSPCAIACALDVLGDKWTLLVIRDLMCNRALYTQMAQSPENIPTSILADRLKRLEHAGVIEKEPYQHNPVRYAYRLTAAGTALHPVLKEIAIWAREHIAGTSVPEEFLRRRPG